MKGMGCHPDRNIGAEARDRIVRAIFADGEPRRVDEVANLAQWSTSSAYFHLRRMLAAGTVTREHRFDPLKTGGRGYYLYSLSR